MCWLNSVCASYKPAQLHKYNTNTQKQNSQKKEQNI